MLVMSVASFTQGSGADTAHAGETEEQAGYGADLARHQFLGKYQDRRERRGQITPITTVSTPVQNRLAYGSIRMNGATPGSRPRSPACGRPYRRSTTQYSAGCHGKQEHEQMQLNRWRQLEFIDQVKREVAAEAGHVKISKKSHQQDADGTAFLRQRHVVVLPCRLALASRRLRLYQLPICHSTRIASKAAPENQAMLLWPCGITTQAASSGPIELPALPPTWKIDCARP